MIDEEEAYYLVREEQEERRLQRRPKCNCCNEPITTEKYVYVDEDDIYYCWDCVSICNIEDLEEEEGDY